MLDEMSYFSKMVWGIATPAEAAKDPPPNAVIVGGRWVLCNKGDVSNPKVRGR